MDEGKPGPAQQHRDQQAAKQHPFEAAPQHRGHLAGIAQVLDEQAIGPSVLFDDELRRANLQQHHDAPPHREPRPDDPYRPRLAAEPRRQQERGASDHREEAQADAQAAPHHRPQTTGIAHARALPDSERQAADRGQDHRGKEEAPTQGEQVRWSLKAIGYFSADARPSVSPDEGMPPCAPSRDTERAAAAHARRTAWSMPRSRNTAKAPLKVSPAPVVSTTSTSKPFW